MGHRHEWRIKDTRKYMIDYADIKAVCDCGKTMNKEKIEHRLNVYESVLEFVKYLYAGDYREIDKRFFNLPEDVRKAIESHPVYGGEDGTE